MTEKEYQTEQDKRYGIVDKILSYSGVEVAHDFRIFDGEDDHQIVLLGRHGDIPKSLAQNLTFAAIRHRFFWSQEDQEITLDFKGKQEDVHQDYLISAQSWGLSINQLKK